MAFSSIKKKFHKKLAPLNNKCHVCLQRIDNSAASNFSRCVVENYTYHSGNFSIRYACSKEAIDIWQIGCGDKINHILYYLRENNKPQRPKELRKTRINYSINLNLQSKEMIISLKTKYVERIILPEPSIISDLSGFSKLNFKNKETLTKQLSRFFILA